MLRVLIVEDEFFAALLLQEDLQAAGYVTLGPYRTLAEAIGAVETDRYDVAILDINLNGEMAFPVIDKLTHRGTPVILLSGYEGRDLPEYLRSLPRISKPYDKTRLLKEIERATMR